VQRAAGCSSISRAFRVLDGTVLRFGRRSVKDPSPSFGRLRIPSHSRFLLTQLSELIATTPVAGTLGSSVGAKNDPTLPGSPVGPVDDPGHSSERPAPRPPQRGLLRIADRHARPSRRPCRGRPDRSSRRCSSARISAWRSFVWDLAAQATRRGWPRPSGSTPAFLPRTRDWQGCPRRARIPQS
jgi:hypothetical protein